MSEVPGASGFEVASAFVRVDPDASDFEGELESQIGGLNYVVKVPVIPDTGDFAGEVDAAVAESRTAVQVPVVPDTGGFQLLIDDAVAQARASVTVPVVPDASGFAEQVDAAVAESEKAVQVPVVPDMGGFAETAETEAAAAGEASGVAFAEKLAAVVASGLDPVWPALYTGAGPAGAEGGSLFGEEFAVAAEPRLSALLSASAANIILPAGTAGEEAGAAFSERFAAATAGIEAPMAALAPAAAAEGAAAGEEAGVSFGSRFAAAISGVSASFAGLIPGMAAEGEAAGAATGEGFAGTLKSTIMGGMGSMEALIGVGFVAVTVDMASHFDAAMERIHTQAGVGQSAIAGLSGGVLDLTAKVGESPGSLAAALYHVESSFASVGISGQSAMNLLQTAAEGARVGNSNLVDTTNALDATIASGIGGIKNYSQAMGALNAIVGAGDMSMQDLADAMGSGLMAVAKSYGQSINDIGAALATFGDNNIRGAKAATDLRMAMQAILSPVKTGQAALENLGLSMTQLGQTMMHHGLTAAIQEFVDRLQASKIPVSDWGQYVTEIFGKKAGAGIGVLVDQVGRLQSKMPDLKRGAEQFGNAWAATQATTSQKFHELEAGVEALMIRIGNGLMPAVDSFMSTVTRNLPAIERFGSSIAHLVAPFVGAFFTGLEAILKVLLGPLKDVTIALGAYLAMELLVAAVNPWLAAAAGLITLAGLIVKYHQQIWDTIKHTWDNVTAFFRKFWPEILVLALGVLGPVGVAVIGLAAIVIKYHKEILDAIEKTWDAARAFVTKIFDDIVRDVVRTFDDIKKAITSGFDGWWKSHGKEIEEVWKAVWDVVKTVFKAYWDYTVVIAKIGWDSLMAVIKPALDLLAIVFKTTWDAISLIFKTAWDTIAAVVKIGVAGIESVIKIAWDIIVGIFNVFLDLITGHWSKAWADMNTMATQIWNAIKAYLGTVWNDIYKLIVQVVNALKSFFVQSWDDIKSGVFSAFNDVRNTIRSIWDGILSDIEGVVNKIKSVIGGIVSAPGRLIGSALSAIGLAGGGVLPGYAPGHDSVNARLSPGEAVLVPEAVRAIGPGRINAINAHYSAGRSRGGDGYSIGGLVPGYADGGMAGGLSPYAAGAAYGAGQQAYSSSAGSLEHAGVNVTFNYYGTQYPTPEQQQAMMMQLSAAVGVS